MLVKEGMELDIQQLKTLQKLGKEKSFSRTSKELGVSQPTVTTRIKVLEEELGVDLILRTGKKAILTEVGDTFLSYVNRALQVYQYGIDGLSTVERFITIAATPTISTYIIPQKLGEIQQKEPNIKWRFLTGSSFEIIQKVQDEIADIGLIRGSVKHEDLNSFPLFLEELYLVLPCSHPLAKHQQLEVSDLTNEKLLIYKRHSGTSNLIEEMFLKFGVNPNISMELEHVMTVKQMVLGGMGIAFLPERAIKKEIESGQLTKVKLEKASIVREVSMISRKNSGSKIEKEILQTFIGSFANS